jgi:hypothetical protein
VIVSLPKWLRNGCFASETTVRRLDPEVIKKIRWGF